MRIYVIKKDKKKIIKLYLISESSTPFVSLRNTAAKGIATRFPIEKIMNVGPNPNNKITALLDNKPIVLPTAPTKLLNPTPVPLLSVGSVSILISLIIPIEPQKAI